MVKPTVSWDEQRQMWVAQSPEWPGNAVALSTSKQTLEDFLKYLTDGDPWLSDDSLSSDTDAIAQARDSG